MVLLAVVIGVAHALGYSNESTQRIVDFYSYHAKSIYAAVFVFLCAVCIKWYLKRPRWLNYPHSARNVKSKQKLIVATIMFFAAVCSAMGAIVTVTAAYNAWQAAYLEKHSDLSQRRSELAAKVKNCQNDPELMETYLCRTRMEEHTKQHLFDDDLQCHQYAWETVFRGPKAVLSILPLHGYVEEPLNLLLAYTIFSTHYIRASLVLLIVVACGIAAAVITLLHRVLIMSGEELLDDIRRHIEHHQRMKLASTATFTTSDSPVIDKTLPSSTQRLEAIVSRNLKQTSREEEMMRILTNLQQGLEEFESASDISGASTA